MIITEAELRLVLGIESTITDAERALLTMLHPSAEREVKRVLGYDPEQQTLTEFYPRTRPDGHQYPAEGRYESTGMRAMWVSNENTETTLLLSHIPVRSITSVHVDYSAKFGQADDAFPADTAWELGVDYYLDLDRASLCRSGLLIAERGWPQVPGSVKVVYVAGYTANEFNGRGETIHTDASPIKEAVIETFMVSWHRSWALRKHSGAGFVPGPITSESLGSYSYTLGGSATSLLGGMTRSIPQAAFERLEPFIHHGTKFLD